MVGRSEVGWRARAEVTGSELSDSVLGLATVGFRVRHRS